MRIFAWLAVLVVLAGAVWLMFARTTALPPPVPWSGPGIRPEAPTSPAAPAASTAPVAAAAAAPAPAPSPDPPKEPPLRVRTNVPGATVWLSFLAKGAKSMTDLPNATAGSDGVAEFVLPRPRAEIDEVEAAASAPGWVGMRHESSGEDITLVLERGFGISGRVVFPDGRPVLDASLSMGRKHALTDDQGRFTLAEVTAGRWEVSCQESGETRAIEAGSAGVEFVMKHHLVRIRVVDEEGARIPLVAFNLKVFDGEVRHLWWTGKWSHERPIPAGAPAGAKVALQCSADGFEGQSLEWTLGDDIGVQDRTVVLARTGAPGTLVLRVNSGPEPLPGKLRVTLIDAGGHWVERFLCIDVPLAEGAARIERASTAIRRIRVDTGSRVDLRNFGIEREMEVRVQPGRETTVDLALAYGGRITVVVKDRTSTVVPARGSKGSYELELLDEEGRKVDIDFGNERKDGMRFPPTLAAPAHGGRALPPGRYSIEVIRYEGEDRKVLARKDLVVALRENTQVEILLPE